MFPFLIAFSVAQIVVSNVILTIVSAPEGPCFCMHTHIMALQGTLTKNPLGQCFHLSFKIDQGDDMITSCGTLSSPSHLTSQMTS